MEWYQANHRPLPWRGTRDPYKIWLSEVILQQTRVAQGLPYYERFVKNFPDVFALAKAPEQSVLRLWQGLGYYSRARNLHTCAKQVKKDFKGKFPTTFEELKKLPGVGDYTAAAIASIAYHEPVAVVDGNVYRVLARIFGKETDITSSEGKKEFFSLANELIDKKRPDLFNQAVMEFGALHCLPKNPKCNACIFSRSCVANQKNLQADLPFKSKKIKVRTRYLNYFVIRSGSQIYMKQRNGKDIWRGLYDFYLIETRRNQKSETLMKADEFLVNASIIYESKAVTHVLSHQKLKVKFITLEMPPVGKEVLKKSGLKKHSAHRIAKLPKPILIERFLNQSNFYTNSNADF